MNIVFVSHLKAEFSAGPTWSVPARVKAQSLYDNVYWINWGESAMVHWIETGLFHSVSCFDGFSLKKLPAPFNTPDFVIFEGFYSMNSMKFAKVLTKSHIPYIITPRGSLTKQARHNSSRFKKDFAHLLWFNSFVIHATSIQFLTENEYLDSNSKCPSHFILSNGFTLPTLCKTDFSNKGIKVIFIGRIDVYHKGIDLLIDACLPIIDKLREAEVSFVIYGPHSSDVNVINKLIHSNSIEDLFFLNDAISGKEKERVLLNADVFVLTSRFEGHPMSLIEALSYGLPALVTSGSNMRKEINDANAGWGCDNNPESIRSALLQMMSERKFFKEKSTNARNLARKYDWKRLADRMHEILLNLSLTN